MSSFSDQSKSNKKVRFSKESGLMEQGIDDKVTGKIVEKYSPYFAKSPKNVDVTADHLKRPYLWDQ